MRGENRLIIMEVPERGPDFPSHDSYTANFKVCETLGVSKLFLPSTVLFSHSFFQPFGSCHGQEWATWPGMSQISSDRLE